jgi:hypothetical protein
VKVIIFAILKEITCNFFVIITDITNKMWFKGIFYTKDKDAYLNLDIAIIYNKSRALL